MMLELRTDIWPAIARICDRSRASKLDVLTGFVSAGASNAIRALGVTPRAIFGLAEVDPALSSAQMAELRELQKLGKIQSRPGLHAKLYLFDDSVVAVGSANFTRHGFDLLEEAILVTDAAPVLRDARALFESLWRGARAVNPAKIRLLPATSKLPRARIWVGPLQRTAALRSLERRAVTCRAATPFFACARTGHAGLDHDEVSWSTSPKTVPGDLQLFCITKDGEGLSEIGDTDARVDTVHSLWRATSPASRDPNSQWPINVASRTSGA